MRVRPAAVAGPAGVVDAPTPFQTPGWYRAWIEQAAASEGARPLVVDVDLPERPNALGVGLQVHEADGERVVRPLSWPWADYHDAWQHGGPHADADHLLAEAIEAVQHREHARLELPDLIDGGLLHQAMTLLGARISPCSPVVAIDLTDRERVRSIVDRKETARKRRALSGMGLLSHTHRHEPAGVMAALPEFFAMHSAQWRDRPDAVAPFDGEVINRTYAAVASQPDACVVLSELRLDGMPLAIYYGFVHRSRYWAYRTAFDQAYRRFSPGHVLVAAMIADFVARGLHTFDLMRGDYPYKRAYASRISMTVRAERDCP